jgi:protein-L-isoaspartate(D-aspartate) O-methyltransferase
MDLALRRRFFAEEIESVAKLRTPALVDAFASVPRERFLPPGPWMVLSETDWAASFAAPAVRHTPDADPARVYHNIVVAIDPERRLFNGQPGTLGAWIDLLELRPGQRALHVGAGLGYFTAVMAHCVGSTGCIVAYEVDPDFAAQARANLASLECVEVRRGDASEAGRAGERFDAILINAGVTHPLPQWLDALTPGGRMVLPITASMGPAGPTLSKGVVFLVVKGGAAMTARAASVVAIYSAIGLRDDSMNDALNKAMMAGPMKWQGVKHLRRDAHDPGASCWFHTPGFCLSTE